MCKKLVHVILTIFWRIQLIYELRTSKVQIHWICMIFPSLLYPSRSTEDKGVGGGKAAETFALQNFWHSTVSADMMFMILIIVASKNESVDHESWLCYKCSLQEDARWRDDEAGTALNSSALLIWIKLVIWIFANHHRGATPIFGVLSRHKTQPIVLMSIVSFTQLKSGRHNMYGTTWPKELSEHA
jgi:hypothetical protein